MPAAGCERWPGFLAMPNLDGWDWVLLGVAGFVAVSSLVRLMRGHRNKVLGEFRANMEREIHEKKKTANSSK